MVFLRPRRRAALFCLAIGASSLGCAGEPPPSRESGEALLASLRERFGEALPHGEVLVSAGERFEAATPGARMALPAYADGEIEIEVAGGLRARIALEGARHAPGVIAGDTVVFAHGLGAADLVIRAIAGGVEDHLHYPAAPSEAVARYRLALEPGTGLRLVAGVLEVVDATGNPGLRVPPPHVVDAEGVRHPADLAVEGCAVDRDPRAPWGRAVTPPGADRCTVTVRWGAISYPALLDPVWVATQTSLLAARHSATIAELAPGAPDTLVLIAGGFNASGNALASAELYHPLHRTFAATGSMSQARGDHASASLGPVVPTGQPAPVLVSGGRASTSGPPLSGIEIYNPAQGAFVTDPNAGVIRANHTATAIAEGTALIAGGFGAGETPQASAAIYALTGFAMNGTPISTLVVTGSMGTARARQASVRLATGNVLVTGGVTPSLQASATAEIFTPDPVTPANGSFAAVPGSGASAQMSVPRARHTATRLADGRVLVAGGTNGALVNNVIDIFLDGTQGPHGFELVASAITMITPRADHGAVLLPTGRVVLGGGLTTGSVVTGAAESFNPQTKAFSALPSATPRRNHATLRVKGGGSSLGGDAVLVAGGRDGAAVLSSAQVLVKLDGESCAIGAECLSGHCVEGICCDQPCGGECTSCLAAFKGSGVDGQCGPVQSGFALPPKCVNDVTVQTECDGAGTVLTTGAEDCKPNTCNVEGTACQIFCTSDADCTNGWCDLSMLGQGGGGGSAGGSGGAGGASSDLVGECKKVGDNGAACTADNQCNSDHCVSGICCNAPCTELCMACNVEGSPGICTLVPAGLPPYGTNASGDPKICPGGGACAGLCDGDTADACEQFPGAETILASACSCPGVGCEVENQICDGAGDTTTAEISCEGFRCGDEESCLALCGRDDDCIEDFICEGASCVALTGPSCDGDQTLRLPAAPDRDCAPYRCPAGQSACATSCASVDDCVVPAVCNAAGQCVAPLTAEEVPTCECRAPGRPAGEVPWLALTALGLAGLARRRRPR
jgi:hypothetical protein